MSLEKSIYGLVGFPVKHSLSPLMHNAAFQALEVEAEYKLFSLEENEIESFFKGLKEENSPIFGLNVTVPYKEKVIPYMDSLAPFAQKANAVNTVVIKEGRKLVGYNTDGPGFLAHMAEIGVKTKGKRVSIIGAGGASRAIITALCLIEDKPDLIKIFDVESIKVDELIQDLGSRFDVSVVENVMSIDDLNVELADILINATPIGLKKDDPCLFEEDVFHSGLFVYDLIYNPAETVLIKMAKAKGAKTASGLGMLYFQGVLAFQHWADLQLEDPIKNIMREALEEGAGLTE